MSARLAMRATYHAIDADNDHVWPDVSAMWSRCLSADTRAKLALTALDACDDDHAYSIAEHVLGGAEQPQASFISHMDQAAFWADMASKDELKAYAVACFNRLPMSERSAFLSWADDRRVVA